MDRCQDNRGEAVVKEWGGGKVDIAKTVIEDRR